MQFDLLMAQSPKIKHLIQECTGVKIKVYKKLMYVIHLENILYEMHLDFIQVEIRLCKMLFGLIQDGEPFVLNAFRFNTKIWTKKMQKMACMKCFSI